MSDWISIKDRLPENGQHVLIAEYDAGYSSHPISGEFFTHQGFIYIDARQGMRTGVDVRYWMPLVEMPKE